MHKDLTEMITESAPHVEVVNRAEIKVPGENYRQMVNELKLKIESITTQVIDAEEGIILEPPLKGMTVDLFLKQVGASLDEDRGS